MIRWIKAWAAGLAASAMLVACGGGGGDSGSCMFDCGSGGSSTVADLRIELSSRTLPNGSADPVGVTVTAVNASNQVVSEAPVLVSADNGGVVTTASAATDGSGQLEATVGMGEDLNPRTITVTVSSGAVTRSTSFQVVAGAGGGDAEMVMTLSSQTVTATNPATVLVTVRNAAGALVPSTVVSFSTVRGLGVFSAPSALTNSQGQATVALYPASSSTSGADEVLATATVDGGSLSTTGGFQITATNVSIESFTSDLGGSDLSAYGQTSLNVTLGGVVDGTPVALSITSLCASKSKATFTPTTLTTTNRRATFTYKDNQCGATEDVDTVTLTITGTTTSANLTIGLSEPSASSIGFVSANPEVIYLRGSGFVEESIVTFIVKDQAGASLEGKSVQLEPTTLTGGLTLDEGTVAVRKPSDSNGQVSVRIRSGTVPTPVRVKATLLDDVGNLTNISTVSSNLSIAVGLPSQLNFSLSQTAQNIEGYNIDGTTNAYTIIASDRLANPVPAGTTVNFVAEGGQIESSRQTTINNGLGSATAQFQSASPRPRNGRVTILAYALGEESFLDADGDNVYDGNESYQDLGDIFLSRRYDAKYEAGRDQYISLSLGGTQTCHNVNANVYPENLLALGDFAPSVGYIEPLQYLTCDTQWGRAYVRRATETVLSTSASRLLWRSFSDGELYDVTRNSTIEFANTDSCQSPYFLFDNNKDVDLILAADAAEGVVQAEVKKVYEGTTNIPGQKTVKYYPVHGTSLYSMPIQGSLTFMVADANHLRLNPMPAGTTITVSATTGITVSVGGGSPVPSTAEARAGVIGYKFTDASSGTIFIRTTTPSGVSTSHSVNVFLEDLVDGNRCPN